MKKLNMLAISAAMAAAMASGSAAAEVTANVAAASNYLFRGLSLSGDAAAVSGGVDYSHESGAYAGVWQSTASPYPETDLYVGYAGEAGDFSYDVGYLAYVYLQNSDANYEEIYFTGGWKFVELFYAHTPTSGAKADYVSLTLSYDKFSFVYGNYNYDDDTLDYTHFDLGVDLTDELNLTYSKNDIDKDDGRLVIAYTLEFDLK